MDGMKDPTLPVDGEARQIAKHLMRTARSGALATNDQASGFPFASLVAVATDIDGSPLILTSQLSIHTKLLEADARCSLLLSASGKGDPLAHPRVTLLAEAKRLERGTPEADRIRRRYLAHQPKAGLYVDFPDFSFWRLDITAASLNGGFGRAYRMARSDVLASMDGLGDLVDMEAGAVGHMNEDHADAVALYATKLCGAREGAWRLSGIDPEGLLLALGDDIVRLDFPQHLTSAAELRPMLVRLAQEARSRTTAG
jgi:putative heme iron utilization protein